MLDCFDFQFCVIDHDIFLHCRLFSWPRDLDELLAVSKKRLQRVKKEAEEALAERTSVFLDRYFLEQSHSKSAALRESMRRTTSCFCKKINLKA